MRKFVGVSLFAYSVIFLAGSFLSGCTAPCSYPDQRGVIVRIINAMPDMPVITVFINGKILVQDFPYDPPATDLYLNTFRDGSLISPGDSAIIVATSDALGKDTVAKGKVLLNFDRQTVVVMGRGHIKPPMKPTSLILRLDDQNEQPHTAQTLIRFVHAIPDLDSLDVFYKGDANGKPDVTLQYGQVYPHFALDRVEGLTVTEAGHPENVIFSFPYSFVLPGVYVTAIIRGESKPVGKDFTTAPLVISDVVPGVYLIPFKTFAVRLVNATRDSKLSLWIRSTTVSPEDTLNPRGSNLGVADYPNQQKVKDIAASLITDFIPLNISLNKITTFWFAKDNNIADTIMFTDTAISDRRYSKIAVEENTLGNTGLKFSHLTLPDTMTNPPGNYGRVRVINLSPDHKSIVMTLNGKTTTIHWKEVQFYDVSLSDTSLKLQDGASSKTYSMPVSLITPISVYILPDQSSGQVLPIATSSD